MFTDIAIITLAISALLGAGYMAYRFSLLKVSPLLGFLLGAVAGAGGSLIFMLPLNYCTFEPERDTLDAAFGILLIGIGMALILFPLEMLIRNVIMRRRFPNNDQSSQGIFKGWLMPFLFLSPTLIVLTLFLYYPAIDTFRISTLLSRLGAPRTVFICVDNFTSLVDNPVYHSVVLNTFVISSAIVIFGLALSLLIATMAYQPIKGASIYRTLLIWPYAISPAVAGIIFLLLFNPTGGIINYFLSNTVGASIPWLNNASAAPWAVIIASIWKSLGYNVLFYIAGLQNVPSDLKEAASIDGANSIQQFFTIVFPLLSPITFFLVITNMTYAFFESFATIDYLTGGGPLRSTTTMMYNIYDLGIKNNDLGKAAAQSIVLFAVVIVLTIIQFRTAGERVNYGA